MKKIKRFFSDLRIYPLTHPRISCSKLTSYKNKPVNDFSFDIFCVKKFYLIFYREKQIHLTKVLFYYGRELKIALPETIMRSPVMKFFAEIIKSSFPVSRKRAYPYTVDFSTARQK